MGEVYPQKTMLEIYYNDKPLKDKECYKILKLIESQKTNEGTIKLGKRLWRFRRKLENLIVEEIELKTEYVKPSDSHQDNA